MVDSTQGVEAQTLANTYLALEHDLEIFTGVQQDRPARRRSGEGQAGGGGHHRPAALDAPEISAKMGVNIPAVLEDIVQNVPAPTGDPDAPLKALIFDSQYDPMWALSSTSG